MFKLKICNIEMKNLFRFTIKVRKSHRQQQCTLQLVCEDLVLFEMIVTFLYAGSSIKTASEQFVSCIHLSFCKRCSSSNPTNKI